MSTPAHPRPPLRPDAGGYTHQDHYWTALHEKFPPTTMEQRMNYRLWSGDPNAIPVNDIDRRFFVVPDPIQRGEASAEQAYDELSLPGGMFKCYQCDAAFNPDTEGGTLSPDPYAMPVCGKCYEEALVEWEARAKVKREKLDPILLTAFEEYEEPPVPTLLQVLDDVVVMLVKPACSECGGEKFVPCEVETATGSTPCPYILEPCPVCNKEAAP